VEGGVEALDVVLENGGAVFGGEEVPV